MDDLISRQAAIDALGEEPPVWYDGDDELAERDQWRRDMDAIKAVPSARPEVTLESAIDYLRNIGWLQEHDRILSESVQPEIIRCKECTYAEQDDDGRWYCRGFGCQVGNEDGSGFCADAERRE